jgi:hypothetical protein
VSARHKSDFMAQRYAVCARFGLETSASYDPNASCQVGRFKIAINVHIESAKSINHDTATLFNSLYQLSQLFLEQIGISPNHGGRVQVKTIIKSATKFNPGLSLEHKMQSTVSVLSEDLRKEITSIFEKQKCMYMSEIEEVRAQMDEWCQSIHSGQPKEPGPPDEPKEAAPPDELSPPDDSSPPDEPSRLNEPHPKPTNRGKKRGGSDNLVEERAFLKKAKGMLKCLKMHHDREILAGMAFDKWRHNISHHDV